jgi:hypothetical protein
MNEELKMTARDMGFRQCGSLEMKNFFIQHNIVSPADRDVLMAEYNEGVRMDEDEMLDGEWVDGCDYDDDGQPSEYEEWQDYMGGDDWDHGQFDGDF